MLYSAKAWQRGLENASFRLWIKTLLKTIHVLKFSTGKQKKYPCAVCQTLNNLKWHTKERC